jgi:hypothetical protein
MVIAPPETIAGFQTEAGLQEGPGGRCHPKLKERPPVVATVLCLACIHVARISAVGAP